MRYIFIISLLLILGDLLANDTLEIKKYSSKNLNLVRYNIDTLNLDYLNKQLFYNDDFVLTNGIVGGIFKNLHLQKSSEIFLTNQIYKFENLHFHEVQKPLTDVHFSVGPNEEQFIDVVHTQNRNERLNITFGLKRFSSLGFYNHQKLKHSDFYMNTNYESKNSKYQNRNIFRTTSVVAFENGGIVDSLFTKNIQPTRRGIPINLRDAVNEVKNLHISSIHSYELGVGTDSNSYLNYQKLGLVIDYKRNYNRYYDDSYDSSFYSIFTDYDSNWIQDLLIENTISSSFIYTINLFDKLSITSGLKTSVIHVEQMLYYTLLFNNTLISDIEYTNDTSYYLNLSFNKSLSGFNQNYTHLELSYSYMLFKNFGFKLDLSHLNNRSNWQTLYYQNSFVSWDNLHFENPKLNQFSLSLISDLSYRNELTMRLNNYNDFIYCDVDSRPNQFSDQFNVFEVKLKYSNNFRRFKLGFNALYQSIIESNVPLNIPDYVLNGKVAYSNFLFSKKLGFTTGLNLYHISRFYGDAYMPMGRIFYLQNNSETGNFIYGDYFVNIDIQNVSAYLVISNISQGITPFNYMMIPNYPLQDRAFRMGIKWRFWN